MQFGDAIEIRDQRSRAIVSPLGAEVRRWSVDGREALWTPDPAVWNAVAPVLFPVVGWTRGGQIKVDGALYPLGLHGFASSRSFALEDRTDAHLRLVDRADAQTRRLYPFDYRLTLDYRIDGPTLSCLAEIANEGACPMPYAFGLHPGFRWPADVEAIVTFDRPETPAVPVITAAGLFSAERRAIPLDGRTLRVTRDLMAREALCFLDMRSTRLTFDAPGFGRLSIAHDDMPHLALWSRPPAPYLCIESWTGHGDPDGFAGELRDKPSMRLLPPGGSARHRVRYTFEPS